MMMKKLNLIVLALLSLAFATVLTSCSDDDTPTPSGEYSNGVFIVNEGNSSSGGSVSFYSYKGDTVANEIFQSVNGRPLGTFVQSLAVHNNNAYIVVNGSNKVEVVKRHTFEEKATITGLDMPRYFVPVSDNKAYLTQWGNNGEIKVIDLQNNEISGSIDVGNGPEKMYTYYDKLFVANGGGLSVDSTISVINVNTDAVIDTIEVGHNPKDMVIDTYGNLWVLCYGDVQYDDSWNVVFESPSELYKIDITTNSVIKSFKISDFLHPDHMEISPDGKTIYYGGGFSFGNIYKMNVNDEELPTSTFSDKYFYGFNVNWTNGVIFATEAPDFTSNGILNRIDPDGTVLGEYEVGIGPNSIGLKKK